MCLMVYSPVLSIVIRTCGVFSSRFSSGCCKLSNQQRRRIALLTPVVEQVKTGRSGKRRMALGEQMEWPS
jgi:hypothetical protein